MLFSRTRRRSRYPRIVPFIKSRSVAFLFQLSHLKTRALTLTAPGLSLFLDVPWLFLVLAATLLISVITRPKSPLPATVLLGCALAHPIHQLWILPALAALVWATFKPNWINGLLVLVAAAIAYLATLLTTPPSIEVRAVAISVALAIALLLKHLEWSAARQKMKTRLIRLRQQSRFRRHQQAQYQPYLPTQAHQAIASGKSVSQIKHRRRHLSVFFSDIHRFTDRVDEMEPEDIARFLNDYLTQMCGIASDFGGTVDKFIGDSLMITFGDDADSDPMANARACLNMAIAMQIEIQRLSEKYIEQYPAGALSVRMGMTAGYCTTGNFGSNERLEYTAIGKHVNLASRLENLAKPGEMLVGYPIWQLLHQEFNFNHFGEVEIKGFARPVSVYRLIDGKVAPQAKSDLSTPAQG